MLCAAARVQVRGTQRYANNVSNERGRPEQCQLKGDLKLQCTRARPPRAMPAQGRQRQRRSTRLSARQLEWRSLRSFYVYAYNINDAPRTGRRKRVASAAAIGSEAGGRKLCYFEAYLHAGLSAPLLSARGAYGQRATSTGNEHAATRVGKLNERARWESCSLQLPLAGRRVAQAVARGDTV